MEKLMQEIGTMSLREYSPITDIRELRIPLYYSFNFYELLRPDSTRKGYVVKNSGQVLVSVDFSFGLIGIYPPYPVVFSLILQPEDFYLADIPEIVPAAAKWLHESDEFGLGELTLSEFF